MHQGYGWCISDWFSVDAFDPEEYSGMSLFHLEDIDFFCRWPFAVENQMYGEFYWAVYMAEALIALVITLLLLRTVTKRPGWLAVKALVMVCAMQLLGESLRQDAVLRWGFVRVGQILGAVVLVAVLMFCCLKASKASKKLMAGSWLGLLASFGLFMAMEFALEKKIVMLEFLPMDVCYLIMTFSCIGMIYAIRPLWKLSDAAT